MSYGDDGKKRRRYAIIGVSSLLLVAMVVAVTVGVSLKNNDDDSSSTNNGNKNGKAQVSTSMKAIKSLCKSTDYKQECVNSLHGVNTTDPTKLVQAAFQVASTKIKEAAKKSITLQQLQKDPRTKMALDQCKELMEYSVDEFKRSFDKLGDFDVSKVDEMLMDLKIWLSAVITYQETCLDGFQNTTGDAAEKMKKAMQSSMHLSSNGLAMVSEISNLLTDLDIPGISKRRLLSSDNPIPVLGHGEINIDLDWTEAGVRRLLSASNGKIKPDVVVAKDGSGQFKSIKEALQKVPKLNKKPFVIYIKSGVYKEYVTVERNMNNVVFIGDGPTRTRITGNKNYVDGFLTSMTATVVILGDNFMARNIGFENSAGASKHQAVALRVNADMAVFYQCAMDGYQDTLYTHAKRQFYRECSISGTIDFVFGDAAAIFQKCTFIVRKPMDNQQCIVTAQGRKERRQASAIIIQEGKFVADPAYYPMRFKLKAYLGRPWKEFSRTIIMESTIDDLIDPQGWLPWAGDFGLRTCFYTEYNNKGAGAAMDKRATWKGVRPMTPEHALDFTVGKFYKGYDWLKASGVPFATGMMSSAKA